MTTRPSGPGRTDDVPFRRYILTGTPGAGKTAVLRRLEVLGQTVVEEAATDVIALEQVQGTAEPWRDPGFIDRIVALQRQRQERFATLPPGVQIFDRSPACTWALATYLGYPPSDALKAEMARIERDRVYETDVLFIDNLGFCTPTEARRISFDEALHFERVHEETYRAFGYRLIRIAPEPVAARVERILGWIASAA
jgi:predicted ATPase